VKSALFKTLSLLLIAGCTAQTPTKPLYTPGLGEFMTQISYRHGKLWFASKAQNWELANYELEEIEEGLADVSQFHPSHGSIIGIPELITALMGDSVKQTALAIRNKNSTAFIAGYDAITTGCNACHQTTGFGFNVIIKPQTNIFSNQQF
jgi:hypothetical protein